MKDESGGSRRTRSSRYARCPNRTTGTCRDGATLDHRVGLAGEDRGQMLDLEMLRQGLYSHGHHRPRSTSAAASAVTRPLLAVRTRRAVEEHSPAAHAGFGVGDGVHQQLAAYLLLGDRLTLHELLQLADVLVAVERDALGVLAVSAGPSGSL